MEGMSDLMGNVKLGCANGRRDPLTEADEAIAMRDAVMDRLRGEIARQEDHLLELRKRLESLRAASNDPCNDQAPVLEQLRRYQQEQIVPRPVQPSQWTPPSPYRSTTEPVWLGGEDRR